MSESSTRTSSRRRGSDSSTVSTKSTIHPYANSSAGSSERGTDPPDTDRRSSGELIDNLEDRPDGRYNPPDRASRDYENRDYSTTATTSRAVTTVQYDKTSYVTPITYYSGHTSSAKAAYESRGYSTKITTSRSATIIRYDKTSYVTHAPTPSYRGGSRAGEHHFHSIPTSGRRWPKLSEESASVADDAGLHCVKLFAKRLSRDHIDSPHHSIAARLSLEYLEMILKIFALRLNHESSSTALLDVCFLIFNKS